MSVLRPALAVIGGLLAGGLLVAAVEAIGHAVFPPPPGTDLANPDDLARIMDLAPPGALAFVLLAWFVGTAAGVWTAIRLHPERARWAGYVVAALLALGAVASMVMIPHPVWFMAAALAVYLGATALGIRLAPAPAEAARPPR